LRTNCRVREVTIDAAGRARGALYYDATGQLREQTAPVVIVACNGVGTPRLLLNSTSRRFPEGLANHNGIVGKNLMFHAIGGVGGYFAEDLESHKGPSAACIFSNEFYETDARRGFVRGYQLQIGRGVGPLLTALGSGPAGRVPWGRDHHAAFARRFGHFAGIGVTGEDLPEECNEVALDPVLTDAHGIPAPLVRYRLSENSLAMLHHGIARATEALEAAGAIETIPNLTAQKVGWHLLGTCRMGDDPARSVVDRWGQAHTVPNLFLIDGSIFVTSAGTNPTTTIQALALRTADHILRERGNLGDAARRRA
jgi:choline dehydrogenase-like flavoprotein